MGKTQKIIEEIIDSEKSYYKGLITFQEVYIAPLMKRNPGLSTSDYEKLKNFFERINAMIVISSELQKHKAFCTKNASAKAMAKCFLKNHKLFSLLKEYIVEYETIFNTARKNSRFNKTCDSLIINPQACNKSISDYAITPIQRITRYSLLLKALIEDSRLTTTKQEYDALHKALSAVESVIKNVNQRDVSESPEYADVMSKIPLKAGESTTPNSTERFCRMYAKNAKSYKRVFGTTLTPKTDKTLRKSIWDNAMRQKSKPRIIRAIEQNFYTPKKESVNSAPKTVESQKGVPPASPIILSKALTQNNNFQKIYTYYKTHTNRTCEQCNPTTLKVKLEDPQLAYYIKEDSNDSKKLTYEAIFSKNETDNTKIIITACEDAADAAIKNGTKMIFDISSSSMSPTIKMLMYETFKAKLEASKLPGQDAPFTITMPSDESVEKIAKRHKKNR